MLENREKIAFFDFCETLVNFQTADAFIDFVRNTTHKRRMVFLEMAQKFMKKIKLIVLLQKISFRKGSINKHFKLYQLKGFTKDEINRFAEEYYKSVIIPNFIPLMINEYERLKKEGWQIVLVSGGYDVYLKEFSKEYKANDIISSTILFENNICTGKMAGPDCIGNNKIILMEKKYDKNYIVSKSYSDSISDVPFLKWTNEGYVVSKYVHQDWVNEYNFKEIIWK